MIRRPPRSTLSSSSAASDVYKRQGLRTYKWRLVVFDEVHKIKNDKSETVAAARDLQTLRRYGLTGTPIQNNYKELWTLLDWCVPDQLGDLRAFRKHFMVPIDRGQSVKADLSAIALKNERSSDLRQLTGEHILVRDKSLIADQLPGKKDLVVLCRMSHLQLSVYRHCLNTPEFRMLRRAKEECDCGSLAERAGCDCLRHM
eukprot:TRINITY_DN13471_c0_g1_i1.p1 TRINITY_DN13471_c0_g1~~TRINITY_DN13471_c0_g1_i1.p1  ORF type:complete len:201 (+),score=46.89 TRINITY_DN13471_c0_g1_i1:73-675(+)